MENRRQNTPKALQVAAPISATIFEDQNDAIGQTSPKILTAVTIFTGIEPEAPTTKPQFKQEAISSSESFEYDHGLPLPTFPYGPCSPGLICGIGPLAVIPQAMQKKTKIVLYHKSWAKKAVYIPDVLRKDNPKITTSTKGTNAKTFSGNNPIAKATVSDDTGKFQFALNTPTP